MKDARLYTKPWTNVEDEQLRSLAISGINAWGMAAELERIVFAVQETRFLPIKDHLYSLALPVWGEAEFFRFAGLSLAQQIVIGASGVTYIAFLKNVRAALFEKRN